MGQATSQASSHPATTSAATCPVDHRTTNKSQCPVDHQSSTQLPSSTQSAQCPVDHSAINPLNQIPTGLSSGLPSSLPNDRVTSSIPKDSSGATWEYPSPQQFHNALVRKGWETPEEHVETMVAIHNFLNEAAWDEVLKWEQKTNPGSNEEVELARFKGRPGELSPKARFFLFAGWLLPSRFNTEAPFDRHDWIIRRPKTNEEVRYIIDYYSAPPEPDGSPAFSLDVRPALDNLGSIKTRLALATEEVWSQFRAGQPIRDNKRSTSS